MDRFHVAPFPDREEADGGHERHADFCRITSYNVCYTKLLRVSTYQAVSGTGQKAIVELENQVRRLMSGQEANPEVYPHQIAFNCLPHIDVFLDNDYTKEEMKMVKETVKIMGDRNNFV